MLIWRPSAGGWGEVREEEDYVGDYLVHDESGWVGVSVCVLCLGHWVTASMCDKPI